MVYPDYKHKCAGPILLPYENSSNNHCCNPIRVFSLFIDDGMPLCHYADAGANGLSTSIITTLCEA